MRKKEQKKKKNGFKVTSKRRKLQAVTYKEKK